MINLQPIHPFLTTTSHSKIIVPKEAHTKSQLFRSYNVKFTSNTIRVVSLKVTQPSFHASSRCAFPTLQRTIGDCYHTYDTGIRLRIPEKALIVYCAHVPEFSEVAHATSLLGPLPKDPIIQILYRQPR